MLNRPGLRLSSAATALLLTVACGGDDATAIARQTCADSTSGENNTPQVMAEGFRQADDAGIAEQDYRDALLKECAMEPPPREDLDAIIEGNG